MSKILFFCLMVTLFLPNNAYIRSLDVFDEEKEMQFTELGINLIRFKQSLLEFYLDPKELSDARKGQLLRIIVEFIEKSRKLMDATVQTRGKGCIPKIIAFTGKIKDIMDIVGKKTNKANLKNTIQETLNSLANSLVACF